MDSVVFYVSRLFGRNKIFIIGKIGNPQRSYTFRFVFRIIISQTFICQLEVFRKTKNIETIYKVRAVLFDCVVPKNLNWKLKLMAFA